MDSGTHPDQQPTRHLRVHSGKIVEQAADSAQALDCMKYVPLPDGGWTPAISAISVWELAHLPHKRTLLKKTEFYNYTQQNAEETPPEKSVIAPFGIIFNEQDLETLEEPGVPATDTGGGFSLWKLLCCGWN